MESLGNLFQSIGTPQPLQRFIFFGAGTYVLLQIVQPQSLYINGTPVAFKWSSNSNERQLLTPITASLLSGLIFSQL